MTELKSAGDADVDVALSSRARRPIHVRGVAAVPGAATSMIMVIPCRTFVLIAQNMKARPYTYRLEMKTFSSIFFNCSKHEISSIDLECHGDTERIFSTISFPLFPFSFSFLFSLLFFSLSFPFPFFFLFPSFLLKLHKHRILATGYVEY
jgi:hypothetical protein